MFILKMLGKTGVLSYMGKLHFPKCDDISVCLWVSKGTRSQDVKINNPNNLGKVCGDYFGNEQI